ncbi:MAG TPA: helix-turn-helix domain-containing protein [Gemmatimonadales bacterium]|nr:helix-turn-helix domain-containing protein [Gemmatimonadales bacterium]
MQRSEALDFTPTRLDSTRMAPRSRAGQVPPPPALAPLSQAVMESLNDGIVVFDASGRVVYANEHARGLAGRDLTGQRGDAVRVRLLGLGGWSAPLRSGGVTLGEAIFLPRSQPARTLAERERQAIVDTLNSARGRLAETARRLGISRTTLWRRLRAYGIRAANGNGRAARG